MIKLNTTLLKLLFSAKSSEHALHHEQGLIAGCLQ